MLTRFSANLLPFLDRATQKVSAIKVRAATFDFSWRAGDEAQQRVLRYRLAAARLTYNPQSLALGDSIGDAVHGFYHSIASMEVGSEIFYR